VAEPQILAKLQAELLLEKNIAYIARAVEREAKKALAAGSKDSTATRKLLDQEKRKLQNLLAALEGGLAAPASVLKAIADREKTIAKLERDLEVATVRPQKVEVGDLTMGGVPAGKPCLAAEGGCPPREIRVPAAQARPEIHAGRSPASGSLRCRRPVRLERAGLFDCTGRHPRAGKPWVCVARRSTKCACGLIGGASGSGNDCTPNKLPLPMDGGSGRQRRGHVPTGRRNSWRRTLPQGVGGWREYRLVAKVAVTESRGHDQRKARRACCLGVGKPSFRRLDSSLHLARKLQGSRVGRPATRRRFLTVALLGVTEPIQDVRCASIVPSHHHRIQELCDCRSRYSSHRLGVRGWRRGLVVQTGITALALVSCVWMDEEWGMMATMSTGLPTTACELARRTLDQCTISASPSVTS